MCVRLCVTTLFTNNWNLLFQLEPMLQNIGTYLNVQTENYLSKTHCVPEMEYYTFVEMNELL